MIFIKNNDSNYIIGHRTNKDLLSLEIINAWDKAINLSKEIEPLLNEMIKGSTINNLSILNNNKSDIIYLYSRIKK